MLSSNGTYLAAANDKNWISIRRVNSCQELRRIQLPDRVTAMAFTPDETSLATLTESDGMTRIWDVLSGTEIARRVPTSEKFGENLVFSPNGEVLAVTERILTPHGYQDMIRLWRWDPREAIKRACARLKRNLTVVEWHQNLLDEPYRKTCQNLPIPGSSDVEQSHQPD